MQVILEAEILCEKWGVISDAQFIAYTCARPTQLLDLQQNSIKDGAQNINIPFIAVTCCIRLCNADSYVKFGQIVHKPVEHNYQ